MGEDVTFFRKCIEKRYFTIDDVARLTDLDVELVNDVLYGEKKLDVRYLRQFHKGTRKVRDLIDMCKKKSVEKKRRIYIIEDKELRSKIEKNIIMRLGL